MDEQLTIVMEDSTNGKDDETVAVQLSDAEPMVEERMQFHAVACDEPEPDVPTTDAPVPMEKEDILVEEDPDEVLAWLEADPIIANRYTDEDPEFAAEMAADDPDIPIVTRWYGKSKSHLDRRTQEMDRKRQHGHSGDHDRRRDSNYKGYSDYRHSGHGSYGPGHYGRGHNQWRDDRRHYNCPNDYRRNDNRHHQHHDRDRRHYDKYPRNDDRRRNDDRSDRRHSDR